MRRSKRAGMWTVTFLTVLTVAAASWLDVINEDCPECSLGENCTGYPTETEQRLIDMELVVPTVKIWMINESSWMAAIRVDDVDICHITRFSCEPTEDAADGWYALCCETMLSAILKAAKGFVGVVEHSGRTMRRPDDRTTVAEGFLLISECRRCPLSCEILMDLPVDRLRYKANATGLRMRWYIEIFAQSYAQILWPDRLQALMNLYAQWNHSVWWNVLWQMSANVTPDASMLSWGDPDYPNNYLGCYLITPGVVRPRVALSNASRYDLSKDYWLAFTWPRYISGKHQRVGYCVMHNYAYPDVCRYYTIRWWAEASLPVYINDAKHPKKMNMTWLAHTWPWDNWTAPATSPAPTTVETTTVSLTSTSTATSSPPTTSTSVSTTSASTTSASTTMEPQSELDPASVERAQSWSVLIGVCGGFLAAGVWWAYVFESILSRRRAAFQMATADENPKVSV